MKPKRPSGERSAGSSASTAFDAGACLSCSAAVEMGENRCKVCVTAVKLALQGLDFPGFWEGCSAVPRRPGSDALSVPCVLANEDS